MPIQNSADADITGTSDNDLIIAQGVGNLATTVTAGAGNDAVIVGIAPAFMDAFAANQTRAGAFSIDASSLWTSGQHDPLVGDDNVPSMTIIGTGNGFTDWFAVSLAANATLTVDIDFANSGYGGPAWDTQVQITDASGTQVALDDDSVPDAGGLGSVRYNPAINATRDTLLTFTATSAGTYYIHIGQYGGSAGPGIVPVGDTYIANVSVTSHAATGTTSPSIYNTVDGGDGADYLVGSNEDDTLLGGAADDRLYGWNGNDTLEGGAGNDLLDGGAGGDTASYEHATAGVTVSLLLADQQDTVGAGLDTLTGIERLIGSAYADKLTGNSGDNLFIGGTGDDQMLGLEGNDQFVLSANSGHDSLEGGDGFDALNLIATTSAWTLDFINENYSNAAGDDLAISSVELILGGNLGETVVSNGTLTFSGSGGDDVFYGGSSGVFDGGDGTDRFDMSGYGLGGDYMVTLAGGYDSLGMALQNVENVTTGDTDDTVTGTSGANVIRTGAGIDVVHAGAGDDLVEGGDGNDMLYGEDGFDTVSYEHATGGVIVNLGTAGSQNTYGAGQDSLSGFEAVIGSAFGDSLTGDSGDNRITGGEGDDAMYGGAGNDTFVWRQGDGYDNIDGGTQTIADILDLRGAGSGFTVNLLTGSAFASGATLTITGIEQVNGTDYNDVLVAADSGSLLYGYGGDDRIRIGQYGPNTADGGDGTDTLDTSAYDAAGDTYVINLAAGTTNFGETILNFENLVAGNTNDIVTGTDGANVIRTFSGNDHVEAGAGDDVVEGGAGDDYLDGGDGIDTADYSGASVGVTVRLGYSAVQNTVGAGMDQLRNFENLTGTAYADTLVGNSASNRIDGGTGADTMTGGKGDDFFTVDNAGDVVLEADGEGSDTVNSSVTYSLAGQYVEVLNLLGSDAINGTGNSLANRIVGNSAANTLVGGDGSDRLDGGAGADTMKGGLGNDTFVVDNALDKIVENDGEGTDTVEAYFTYSLAGQYIEILKLLGTGNFNGTGNSLANTLYGNSGDNQLNGAAGADTMYGGAGNDTYIVDNVGDRVFENNGEGTDTVQSSVTFSINGQYVENLTLTGAAAINGTGNSLANVLTGNGAANTLSAGGGNDQLHGGLGSDTLTGGAGQDTYWFETALGATNVDNITDFSVADDTINLDRTIFAGITANGALAAAAFWQGAAAHDADDRIVYDKATGNIYYDADGTGAGAAVLFAHVAANTALTAADFFAVP